MLTEKDLLQLKTKGIQPEMIGHQLEQFRKGFPFIRLLCPATSGDGLVSLTEDEKKYFHSYFIDHSGKARIIKFVPASGAATRMFKHLFEYMEHSRKKRPDAEKILNEGGFNSPKNFLENLPLFAFSDELRSALANDGKSLDQLLEAKYYAEVIEYTLLDKGLNYASLPKALLAFHRYGDDYRVAAEEHLAEAANYAADDQKKAAMHFTVSPEHIARFNERIQKVKGIYERMFGVSLTISHSIQKPYTDTIAVNKSNEPVRNPDGALLFRPAGHGALLENLNDLDAEIVFIKNIDNVVPDHLKATTYEYKRIIGGYLLEVRNLVADFLRKAESTTLSDEEVSSMADLAASRFNIQIPPTLGDTKKKKEFLIRKLNRPIRVCGMVKNVGEPGGGPFWVENNQGEASLQIVESSQVNSGNPEQMKIFCSSTHFNPVDLVCCIRDYKGKKFNLRDFVDESTGFISIKSSGGKELKAMELPGLWNGSMADWITVFVEVPLITFNPVKTVNDLLRNEHQ